MGNVRVGRNPMTSIGSVHGGASSNGRNPVDPPGGVEFMVVVRSAEI